MPEAKMKAETEKPLSPEFQANRSMFRYFPESRQNLFSIFCRSFFHRARDVDSPRKNDLQKIENKFLSAEASRLGPPFCFQFLCRSLKKGAWGRKRDVGKGDLRQEPIQG